MPPIVHNIHELPASELERYFRDHPEPLRALAERLQDSEAELDELLDMKLQLEKTSEELTCVEDELSAEEIKYEELLSEFDKLANAYAALERKLNERKRSA